MNPAIERAAKAMWETVATPDLPESVRKPWEAVSSPFQARWLHYAIAALESAGVLSPEEADDAREIVGPPISAAEIWELDEGGSEDEA